MLHLSIKGPEDNQFGKMLRAKVEEQEQNPMSDRVLDHKKTKFNNKE